MSTYYNNNGYNTPSPGPGPGSSGPNQNGGKNGGTDWIETVSWIVDIGLIFAWFPVGLVLTIANATGHNFVGKLLRKILNNSSASVKVDMPGVHIKTGYDVGQKRTTSSRVYGNQAQSGAAYSEPAREQNAGEQNASAEGWQPKEETKAEAAADGLPKDKGARAMSIAGWIVGVFAALATLVHVVTGAGIWTVLTWLAVALGGGALAWAGWNRRKKEKAFKRCFTVSGNTGVVKIGNLAGTLGVPQEQLEKQLQEMIDRGYYGERAYIDHARGLLVIEPEHMRDVYKAEDEAAAAGKAAQAKKAEASARTEYEKIIDQIRQADEDIDDEAMSEKIRTMQEITAAIFQEVEAHPEKKSQIQRFMNYYLPTTLKLLDSYARIEQQGVSGENMARSKSEIERIADTLVEGYRKQLDTLYRSDAVDIAGDVSVIENMMRRDGLTGRDDFHIRRTADETPQEAEPEAPAQAEAEAAGEGQVLGGH